MVEFALLLPMLIVLLLGIADFGRVFQAGITTEAAARDAAEAARRSTCETVPARRHALRTSRLPCPSSLTTTAPRTTRPSTTLPRARRAAKLRVLANTTYTPDDPGTPGVNEEVDASDLDRSS